MSLQPPAVERQPSGGRPVRADDERISMLDAAPTDRRGDRMIQDEHPAAARQG